MQSPSSIRQQRPSAVDRACGALIGHAIGDSFGDAARTAENHFLVGITMDFREGPAPGTDDTEFALLTARTLLHCRAELTDDHVLASWKEHVLPLSELKRGGASEREAAENIRRGILPPLSGQFNSHYMSDGAAMRVTPIGIVAAGDPGKAARLADVEARISHWRDGIWGAQAVAVGVCVAMAGGTVREVFDEALRVLPEESWMRATMLRVHDIVEAKPALEEAWVPLHAALWTEYKAAAPEAVAEAFAVFLLTNGDFRRGVIYGGNWGRDADTIAAIVGALAGAMHGRAAIPQAWIDKVRYPAGTCLPFTKGSDIFDVATSLAGLI